MYLYTHTHIQDYILTGTYVNSFINALMSIQLFLSCVNIHFHCYRDLHFILVLTNRYNV